MFTTDNTQARLDDILRHTEQLRGDRTELHNALAALLSCLDNPAKIKALRPQLNELVERTAPTPSKPSK